MKSYRFLQVDVFTDQPFGGNPLAVFPEATGLSTLEMQKLAREMNLSETTFVLPADKRKADFKVRIFTPAKELPFAGHPVVGTHWVLAHLKEVYLKEPVTHVSFDLGVGVLPADLHVARGVVERVVMTQDEPKFLQVLEDVNDLAKALGLTTQAILDTGWPVQVVSTGLPQLMIPVRSLAEIQALDPGRLNVAALNQITQALGVDVVLVFTRETEREDRDVHVRVFAPAVGVPEDPATGSANGALGAYLVHNHVIPVPSQTVHITSEQGSEMGRPSTVYIEVDTLDGDASLVRVGGQVIQVAEGVVRF